MATTDLQSGARLVFHRTVRGWPLRAACLMLFVAPCWSGCSSQSTDTADENPDAAAASAEANPAEDNSANVEPRQLLEQMAAAYRRAESYADSGQFRLRFSQGERDIDQQENFSVVFQRPDKLRMHAYQGTIVCDGQQLFGVIGDLPGQVLKTAAPGPLTLENIFVDPLLMGVMNEGIVGGSLQLVLLLHDAPLDLILQGATGLKYLPPAEIDGAACQRVAASHNEGEMVFWVDSQSLVLRRFEYPVRGLTAMLSEQGAAVDGVSLVADFHGARLNESPPETAFQFELPNGAAVVERFALDNTGPAPQAPSQLLGKQIPAFRFTTPDGQEITRESLAGKVAVLDFWATWCQPCFQSLPNLEKVHQQFRDNPRVAIIAVSIDEQSVTEEKLKEAFQQAGLGIPIARDGQEQHASRTFGIESIPSLFVLGPDGTVQDNEVGANPQLAEELPGRIERLLAGESIWEESLRRYEERLRQHQQSAAAGTEQVELPTAQIAAASPPQTLAAEQLWRSDEVARPGNLLLVGSGEDARLYALDGYKAVVQLEASGKLLERHALELPTEPEEAVITMLRTAEDGGGNRVFVASASAQQQLHIFNDQFQILRSYPEDANHSGIADVQLADLTGDGQLEIAVSYWGSAGVQCIGLDAQRKWWNRALDNVFRLAVTGPDADGKRLLLAANGRGTLVPIDHLGQEQPAWRADDRFLRSVVAADLDGDGQTEYCAIAAFRAGADALIGLDHRGQVQWEYELPLGVQPAAAVEMLTAADVLGERTRQWIVCGADGSLHLLDAAGKLVDKFNTGEAVTGLAGGQLARGPALLVASKSGITAWRLSR